MKHLSFFSVTGMALGKVCDCAPNLMRGNDLAETWKSLKKLGSNSLGK